MAYFLKFPDAQMSLAQDVIIQGGDDFVLTVDFYFDSNYSGGWKNTFLSGGGENWHDLVWMRKNYVAFSGQGFSFSDITGDSWYTFRLVRQGGTLEVFCNPLSGPEDFEGSGFYSLGSTTSDRYGAFRVIGNYTDTLSDFWIRRQRLEVNGVLLHDWNPSLSGGTGIVMPDAIGGNDATQIGPEWPADDSVWVYYESPDDTVVYSMELSTGQMVMSGSQTTLEKKVPPFTDGSDNPDQPDSSGTLYELDFSLTPESHLYAPNGLGLGAGSGENFEFEIQFFFRTADKNGHSPNVLVAYRNDELVTVIFKEDRLDIFGREIVFGETFSTGQWLTLKLVRQDGQNVECFIQKQGEASAQNYGSIDYPGVVSWSYIGRRSTAVTDPAQSESDFSLRALKHSVAGEVVIDFDFASSGANNNDQLTNAIPTSTGAYRYAALVDFPTDGSHWVPYELSSNQPGIPALDMSKGSHINLDGVFRMSASEDYAFAVDFTFDGQVSGFLGDTSSESRMILHADKAIFYGVYGESVTVNFTSPLQLNERYTLFITLQFGTLIVEVSDTRTSVDFPHDLWFNTFGNDGDTSFIANFTGKLFSIYQSNNTTFEEDEYLIDENSTGNTIASGYSDSVIRLISFPTDDSQYVMYMESPPVTVTYDISLSGGAIASYLDLMRGMHQRSINTNGAVTETQGRDFELSYNRFLAAQQARMSINGQEAFTAYNRALPGQGAQLNTGGGGLFAAYDRFLTIQQARFDTTPDSPLTLHYDRALALSEGVNQLDLANLSLSYGRALTLEANKGKSAYSGYDMTMQYDRALEVSGGETAYSGYEITTAYDRLLSMSQGKQVSEGSKLSAYWQRFVRLMAGMNTAYGAGMNQHVDRYLSLSDGNMHIEINNQRTHYDRALQLANAEFVTKGESISFSFLNANTYNIDLAIGRTYTTGQALRALQERRLLINPFTTSIDGATMYVNVDRLISLNSGDMQSQGSDAAIAVQRLLSLGEGQVNTAGYTAGFAYNPMMQLSGGQANYAGASVSMEVINPLDLNAGVKMGGYTVKFALSPVAVTFKSNL